MKTSTTKIAATGAALALTAITASCSIVTGGTPVSSHTSSPGSTVGAAPSNSPATPAPAPTVSAEDQVRQTVLAFQDAYNTQNWDAYTGLMCTAMRVQFTGPVMDYVKKGRAETGLTRTTIVSVAITGDTAVAVMNSENEAVGSRTVTMPLKLEHGWKICRT